VNQINKVHDDVRADNRCIFSMITESRTSNNDIPKRLWKNAIKHESFTHNCRLSWTTWVYL